MAEKTYLHQKKLWIKLIKKIIDNKKVKQNLYLKYFKPNEVEVLKINVLKEFEYLLPQVPYIGTVKNNPFLIFLIFTAISLSFYRVLKKEGWEVEKIGQIIYEIADNYYGSMNPVIKKFLKWYIGSSIMLKRFRHAEKCQKNNQNPWDYKASFIPGDSKNLLFGYDYTECGGLKFLKAQNAEEIAPYLCLCDYAMFQALKIGFKRSKNLALGANVCDFRFFKNYATPCGWPPNKLDEYQNFNLHEKVGKINEFSVYKLTKKLAQKHASTFAKIADQIPLVDYTEKEILAEKKEDRVFHGKWNHSLVVFDQSKPIAFIMGYERKAEGNDQYPKNSLYISELGVLRTYQKQGIGRQLVKLFLDLNKKFLYLDGMMIYSIQTNSADFNQHVQNLYKSFGFKHQASKEYNNRTDVILVKRLD